MSSEDAEARQLAMSHVDSHTPMALLDEKRDIPPRAESAKPKGRLTPEEKERRAQERARAREEAKSERAAARMIAKTAERNAKIAEAEGGRVELPAVVLRNGHVGHVSDQDAWAVIAMYLDDLMLDCENSGFPIGHPLYELRTVQVGGEDAAIVFDASDPAQMQIAALALEMARRIWAHSASVDAIMVILAGLIDWDVIWAKMNDSVLRAKLTDPAMSGSDADALKELSDDLLREYAVSPAAEKDKNALFKAMGCLVKTDLSTPAERNGWYCVNRYSVVMTRYAGSDVLDLGAVLRVLPPLPVEERVMTREREFEAACAPVSYVGFQLDGPHVKMKIAEAESAKAEAQRNVAILSDGKITNPKSPDVIKLLPEIIPGLELPVDRKTKRPSAGKASLEQVARTDDPLVKHLCKQILEYRQQDTKLGLLLRPFEALCDYGDGRMRPTVYTIEASTGRSSCRRPNAQQLSRQGGVRACVKAGEMLLALIDNQWRYFAGGELIEMRGISADFKGCEIRVAAGLSGDSGLLQAENSPWCHKCEVDAFLEQPCSCGLKEEDGKTELKAHSGLHWMAAHMAFGNDATKEHRYWCKRGIFTRLFGGGPDTAAGQVFCDVANMHKVWKAFNGIAGPYTQWDNELRAAYDEGSLCWRDYETGQNFAQPIEGKKRMVYRTYSGRNIYIRNGQHAAGNGAIQGTAREVLVDGVLTWAQTRWGKLPLLPIHDQILAMVPAHEAEEASHVLAQCMRTRVLSSPGFEVEIGVDIDTPFTSWPDSSLSW